MRLFPPDLYRNFAIGFAVGALALGVANAGTGPEAQPEPIETSAVAAPIAADFRITPLEVA
ncbi:MAG: hypothetical protein WA985_03185 [Erythrobacter sp.]